jgi:hypothetical protein
MNPSFKKTLSFTLNLLLILSLTSGLVSCSQQPAVTSSAPSEQLPVSTQTAESNPTKQAEFFENTYGVTVLAKALCADGTNTTLYLETNLDASLWQLNEKDFYPLGKTYFETSILFFENGEMFSVYSSGKRDDPIFNSQNKVISTTQIFVFPKVPSSNSTFTIKAKVTLLDLPATYAPSVKMDFLESGIIEVPMEYVAPATIGDCP